MVKLTFNQKIFVTTSIILIIGVVLYYIRHVYIITPNELRLNFHNILLSSVLSLISNLILATIAFIGLFLTVKSIKANTSSAQKQATIQVVMDINADQRLQDTKNLIFLKGTQATEYYINLSCLQRPSETSTDEEKEKFRKEFLANEKLKDDIHYVLNRYEFIALGIRKGAFDEELFKDFHYSNFEKLWRYSKPLVMHIRSEGGIETIYQELEYLMMRWEKDPIKKLQQ